MNGKNIKRLALEKLYITPVWTTSPSKSVNAAYNKDLS